MGLRAGTGVAAREAPKSCGITVYRYDEELGRLALKEYTTVAG
jgi:hypothetical protein